MRYYFLFIVLLLSGLSKAQNQGGFDSSRLTYGGNIGFTFGSQTVIDVSPRVGYYVTDRFLPGVSASYRYFKIGDYSDNMYGAGLFTRFFLSEELFLHAETEMTNLTEYLLIRDYVITKGRTWVNTTMVGGGYMSGPFSLTFLYILNHDPYTSPYGSSPLVIQGGIMF